MARKVFISFLGATVYSECTYTKQGCNDFSDTNPYIQIATLKYLDKYVSKWEGDDIALILLTKKAETDNWLPHGLERGLKTRMDEIQFPYDTVKDLPVGDNEGELITIFMKVFDKLHTGDELYFDITHAFRFMPMLIMVLTNYSKFAKTCKVKWISYGKTVYPFTEGTIVELNKLSILQDWTTGAADFVDNGNVDKLIKLSIDELSSKLLMSEESDTTSISKSAHTNEEKIQTFTNTLTQVIDDIKMCRGIEVINGNKIKNLREQRNEIELSADFQPFNPILDKIMDSLKFFSSEKDIFNGLKAANWCLDHSLYQQSITYIEETIISFICEQYKIDLVDRRKREIISNSFDILTVPKPEKEWDKGENENHEENIRFFHQLMDENTFVKNYYKSVCEIKALRNDINHAGMRKQPLPAGILKEKIQSLIDSFTMILKLYKGEEPTVFDSNKIIIISNQSLSEKEKEDLSKINRPLDVINLEYPIVFETLDKTKDSKRIRVEVNKLLEQIIGYSDYRPCYLYMSNKLINNIEKRDSYDSLKLRTKKLRYKLVNSLKGL